MGGLFSIDSPVWRLIDKILHLLWINILWLVCSIPIVTIGASTTAVYSVTLKMVRNQEGYITQSFWKAFKENFKQSTIIWLVMMILGIILGADFLLYIRSGATDLWHMILMVVFFGGVVVFLMIHNYVYAVLAKFDNSTWRTVLNAFIMSVRHLPSSVLMICIAFGILALGFMVFPPILFLGFGLIAYVNSCFFVKIFDRYVQ
ncbi:MAG: YesL family protein [Hungatella sp.]